MRSDKPNAYYAVANGRVLGIYDNWADTKEQVFRFSHCDFRKFYCWDDCFRYLRSKGLTEGDFESNCGRVHKERYNPHKRFYAVADGRNIGIYALWENCKNDVLGLRGADWKIFECKYDAKQYMKKRGHKDYPKEISQTEIPNPLVDIDFQRDKEGRVKVFADGSAINNGQLGATAGIGIYWGIPNHPLNLAAPVEGSKATNIVAEIQAVIAACRIAFKFNINKLRIYTDSEYVIKCMNEWWANWIINGFRTAHNKPVENREILQQLKALLEKVDVKFEHVIGHTGVRGNEEADKLAKRGAKMYNNNE